MRKKFKKERDIEVLKGRNKEREGRRAGDCDSDGVSEERTLEKELFLRRKDVSHERKREGEKERER